MCGIVGIYYFDPARQVTQPELVAMADRIVHRGPNDAGYHLAGNVGIGMRRLSIIDLSGGHQPIYSADGRQVIVFNGEVYNFQEERDELERRGHRFTTHSDTEVVLHLYMEHGERFVDHANGMFGLAIRDEASGELFVVRDRIGIKPLYYYRDEEKLLFASEIKAILAHPKVRVELDFDGLAAFLKYGFTPAPYTLFKNIRKIPPAHLMRIKGRDVSLKEYWRPSYRDKFTDSEETLKERLYELLKSSVRYQMIADVPLGAFLSGGLDSSGIVHLMKELAAAEINTYSIGFGAGFDMHNELPAARQFARDYGTNHHEIVVEPKVAELFPKLIASLDEPVADSSFIVTYLVSKMARETVTVILSGVGGDELFGGYRRYLNTRLHRYLAWLPASVRRQFLAPLARRIPVDRNSPLLNYFRLGRAFLEHADLPPTQQYGAYTSVFSEEARGQLLTRTGEVPDLLEQRINECDSEDPLDQVMYFDLRMSLPEQLLMLTDKMTMAVSLEGRVPYLDHRVVEFAARVPSHLKIKGLQLRHIQRAVFRGRLPDYVFERRKRGFGAPVGAWVRNDLSEMLNDLLGESRLRQQGIFSAAAVRRTLDEHFSFRKDHTDHILALVAFQLWHDQYLAGAASV